VRSSVKPSHVANYHNLIDRTRAVWQPRLGRDLSREDARQIAGNVTGFFAVLAEWRAGCDFGSVCPWLQNAPHWFTTDIRDRRSLGTCPNDLDRTYR
jgi:hypothetical protein